MNLVLTRGCICDDLTINDISISYLEEKDKQEILDKCLKIFTKEDLYPLLVFLIEEKGKYEYQYHCDECGDDVYCYTLEIKD